MTDPQFILYSIAVFLVTILVLVAILLIAKRYLTPSGKVTITINGKEKSRLTKVRAFYPPFQRMGFTSRLHAVERVHADNASAKFPKVVEKFSTSRKDTSPASKLKSTTVWAANAK